MVRRALGIAFWIETAFQIDRKEIGLDLFMPVNRHELVPMAAGCPDYSKIEGGIRKRYDTLRTTGYSICV
jgi:hypothetical protein